MTGVAAEIRHRRGAHQFRYSHLAADAGRAGSASRSRRRPNDRYVGLVLLFSTHTGEPLAIYPDGIVQRMRVAATCGLAAKYLARPDARVVALLGTGWQAGGQAMAIAAVRPIERIRCYSPDPERRQAFAREMSAELGIEVVAAASAREAVAGADVVMCATSSMQPVLSAEWIEPGMHVSSLKRLELDASWRRPADVVVTHVRKAAVADRAHGGCGSGARDRD